MCLFFPVAIYASDDLYIGGDSVGIQVGYDGVLISGTYTYQVDGKTYDPSSVLHAKDIIQAINGVSVHSLDDLYAELNTYQSATNEIPIQILRDGNTLSLTMISTYDATQKSFKSGLYVKDKIVGVGTLTYYDPSTSTYGALGHEIMDSDVKEIANIQSGNLYPAKVESIAKAQENVPGEKHAQIDFTKPFATVEKNTNIGIYGVYSSLPSNVQSLPWATKEEVQKGPAEIYTVLHGSKIEKFSITITKVNPQDSSSIKGIEYVVDDPNLLAQTNGIIQGMSGSPIVQNGKIIGAVTHVVTAKPMNGYGVYIEWMLEKSRALKP